MSTTLRRFKILDGLMVYRTGGEGCDGWYAGVKKQPESGPLPRREA